MDRCEVMGILERGSVDGASPMGEPAGGIDAEIRPARPRPVGVLHAVPGQIPEVVLLGERDQSVETRLGGCARETARTKSRTRRGLIMEDWNSMGPGRREEQHTSVQRQVVYESLFTSELPKGAAASSVAIASTLRPN